MGLNFACQTACTVFIKIQRKYTIPEILILTTQVFVHQALKVKLVYQFDDSITRFCVLKPTNQQLMLVYMVLNCDFIYWKCTVACCSSKHGKNIPEISFFSIWVSRKLKVLGNLIRGNFVMLTNPPFLHNSLDQHTQFGCYKLHSSVLGSFQNTQILNQQYSCVVPSSWLNGELINLAENLVMQVLTYFLFSSEYLEMLFSDLLVLVASFLGWRLWGVMIAERITRSPLKEGENLMEVQCRKTSRKGAFSTDLYC